jgi:hypothetical protein
VTSSGTTPTIFKELIRLHEEFLAWVVDRTPVLRFVENHAEPGTFHYVGAGVAVGQAGRLLC